MTDTTRIFVSHSHQDDAFGRRLIADLRRDLGSDDAVWYDASGGLHGGDAWWRTIVAEITAREVFLVVLSPDAVASKWVEDEIDLAWQQKNSAAGKLIIPLLYRTCAVRPDLTTRQMIAFTAPRAYDAAYAELLTALGIRPAPATPPRPHAPLALPPETSRVVWCMQPDRAFGHRFVGDLCAHDDRAILRVFDDRDEDDDLALARALAKAYTTQPEHCPGVAVALSYEALMAPDFLTLLRVFDPDVNTSHAEARDWPVFVTADAQIARDIDAVALSEWPVYDLGSDYAAELRRFLADAGVL